MNLDSIQTEIVTSKSKNIIVSAGAGSGKTRVLTERVRHLLKEGVTPDSIVCITFTNRAASEMKQRLSDVVGIGDAFIGTIHSFANRIYKNSGTPYELLTGEKRVEIMKYLVKTYAKHLTIEDYLEYVDMKTAIDLGMRDEGDISDRFSSNILNEINIFEGNRSQEDKQDYPEDLYTVCSARNIITFKQLLIECTKYFESIGGKLQYLLVDELQDIGNDEYKFIMSLNADNNFFVGDDWQSIYSFKGGDVRIFLSLMRDPEWSTYYLTSNYRNSTAILDIAKLVINQAEGIIEKEVVPVREDSGSVQVMSKNNLREYLQTIKDEGNYKEWFLLVRANKDINEVSVQLLSLGIPFVSFRQGGHTQEDIETLMAMDSVKVLTVHSAKGLENKNVILYGNFPVRQPNYMRNSEERKVMYVGITRAQDRLIIMN